MPAQMQEDGGGQVISTFIPARDADMLAALRAHAAENERTLAAEIRRALRLYIQNDNDPAGNRAEVNNGGRDGAHVTE